MRNVLRTFIFTTCALLFVASMAAANVPDPFQCTVSDCLINTCPYVHDPATAAASERECELTVTLLNAAGDPVVGYPCASMVFTVVPHPAYPDLGGGPLGDCPGCENHYNVTCLTVASDINGEIQILVDLGDGCAPSMCCPVEVWVTLIPEGQIPDPGEVFQNTFDLVPNGDVRGPDFGYFSTCFVSSIMGNLEECCDFIWTPPGPPPWGVVDGSDFAAFATHYTDCCGRLKEPDPSNCDPFTDPCP